MNDPPGPVKPGDSRPGNGSQFVDPPMHARAACLAIEALGDEVHHGRGYLWPSQIHATIGHLWLLTHRLPWVLTQAGSWLEAASTADH